MSIKPSTREVAENSIGKKVDLKDVHALLIVDQITERLQTVGGPIFNICSHEEQTITKINAVATNDSVNLSSDWTTDPDALLIEDLQDLQLKDDEKEFNRLIRGLRREYIDAVQLSHKGISEFIKITRRIATAQKVVEIEYFVTSALRGVFLSGIRNTLSDMKILPRDAAVTYPEEVASGSDEEREAFSDLVKTVFTACPRYIFALAKLLRVEMRFRHDDIDARESAQLYANILHSAGIQSAEIVLKDSPKESKRTYQPKTDQPRIQRNDPCPCGSGCKFKKCCMGQKNFFEN